MQTAEVQNVCRITNAPLWKRYMSCLQMISEEHADQEISPKPLQAPWQTCFTELLPWMKLRSSLNEVLLFHGCKRGTANTVVQTGFDPRVANTGGLYGEGSYFACQACKSMQYTDAHDHNDQRCILLCRVALGDPEYVKEARKGTKRPSERDPSNPLKGLHDSFVVNPGCEGGPSAQEHREFVIFKAEQVYPELAMWFRACALKD